MVATITPTSKTTSRKVNGTWSCQKLSQKPLLKSHLRHPRKTKKKKRKRRKKRKRNRRKRRRLMRRVSIGRACLKVRERRWQRRSKLRKIKNNNSRRKTSRKSSKRNNKLNLTILCVTSRFHTQTLNRASTGLTSTIAL